MPDHTFSMTDEEYAAVTWVAETRYNRTDVDQYLDDTIAFHILTPSVNQQKAANAPAAPLDITAAYVEATPEVQEEVRVLLNVEPAPPPPAPPPMIQEPT